MDSFSEFEKKEKKYRIKIYIKEGTTCTNTAKSES